MKATAEFILVSLAVVGGLLLLAKLFERFFCKDRLRLSSPRYITTVSISAALACVFMLLEIPLLFLAPSFYKLDASELPVLISAFCLGPVAGVLTEFLKILLKILLKGSSTAFVGELANFAIGCALILPASMIYHLRRSVKSALVGLIVGTLTMVVFGSLFNVVYLLPAFAEMYYGDASVIENFVEMGTAINSRITNLSSFILLAVAPLNLLKGLGVSVLTLLLYKPFEPITRKQSH